MKAADLFCGAGGASLGLIQAGFDMVYALDMDADAVATYRANIGDHCHLGKIEDVDPADIPDLTLLHGSPPCQGFSYAGLRDRNDPRNRLWREFFRIVKAKQPEWITIENVRGMLSMGEDKALVLAFREIGYSVRPVLVNAADYGVPQKRYRVFYIGNRLGLPNPVPTQTHTEATGSTMMFDLQPWVTVRQALGIKGVGGLNVDRPAYTMTVSYDGSLPNSPKHPGTFLLDEPSHTIRSGTHGQPGYSPRHQGGYVPTETTDHGVLDLDAPSCTIKAGGMRDASGHEGGATPPSIPLAMRDKGKDDGSRSVWFDADGPMRTIKTDSRFEIEVEPHRLRNRYAEHGDGSTIDEPAPTVSADRGLEEHWLADEYDVAPTIQADSRGSKPGHHGPGKPRMMLRRLTPWECQILQDFPPDFTFTGTKTSQHRQIGNAVPPGLAHAIGLAIRGVIERANEEAA